MNTAIIILVITVVIICVLQFLTIIRLVSKKSVILTDDELGAVVEILNKLEDCVPWLAKKQNPDKKTMTVIGLELSSNDIKFVFNENSMKGYFQLCRKIDNFVKKQTNSHSM